MSNYELVIIRIDQLSEVDAETWQVHVEGYINAIDDEGCDMSDFNCDNWHGDETSAEISAQEIAKLLITTKQTNSVEILKSGNSISIND